MEVPKLMILLSSIYLAFASHSSHYTIPIEGYSSELQDLGQHVEIPETPVKVIKITKTVAVKIPVPYPVRITEKVPYPVHVAKPYPVPVPQIIKVPHVASPKNGHDTGYEGYHQEGQDGSTYQVQENNPSSGHSLGSSDGFEGSNAGHGHNYDGDFSYEGTPSYSDSNGHHGYSGSAGSAGNEESKNYDQAINNYFNQKQFGADTGGSNNYHYH